MRKHIIFIPFILLVLFALAISFLSPVMLAYQYGDQEEKPKDITINKQVRNPITGEYWENLLSGDATYSPKSEVTYMLRIHNSGDQDFSEVKITDNLPAQLKDARVHDDDKDKVFDESYNSNDNVLTFKLKDGLKDDETKEVKITATVKDRSAFASDQTLHCSITNYAKAEANGEWDEDRAELCVQTDVLGVTTLPEAGLEDWLPLLPFIVIGITGINLAFKRG